MAEIKTKKRRRKPKADRFEATISFGASAAMQGRISGFLDANPMLQNTAAACRYLIGVGLDAAEKEAARG